MFVFEIRSIPNIRENSGTEISYHFLLINWSFSNFLMGIYMLGLCIVGILYNVRNIYLKKNCATLILFLGEILHYRYILALKQGMFSFGSYLDALGGNFSHFDGPSRCKSNLRHL